jgi:uncharacterized membrane protein
MADAAIRLLVLSWVFTALLLVLLIASVAAARGALRLNHLFGVRLPALMTSEAAWRRGHAAAVAFGVAIVASLVGMAVPVSYWLAIAAFVAGVIAVFVRATAAARTVRSS